MNPQQPYPYIAYEGKHGKYEIVACAPRRFRLIYQGNFVAAFSTMAHAVRYMNREFVCQTLN